MNVFIISKQNNADSVLLHALKLSLSLASSRYYCLAVILVIFVSSVLPWLATQIIHFTSLRCRPTSLITVFWRNAVELTTAGLLCVKRCQTLNSPLQTQQVNSVIIQYRVVALHTCSIMLRQARFVDCLAEASNVLLIFDLSASAVWKLSHLRRWLRAQTLNSYWLNNISFITYIANLYHL